MTQQLIDVRVRIIYTIRCKMIAKMPKNEQQYRIDIRVNNGT